MTVTWDELSALAEPGMIVKITQALPACGGQVEIPAGTSAKIVENSLNEMEPTLIMRGLGDGSEFYIFGPGSPGHAAWLQEAPIQILVTPRIVVPCQSVSPAKCWAGHWRTSRGEPRSAWAVDYYVPDPLTGRPRPHRKQFPTETDAQRFAARTFVDVEVGVHVPDSRSCTVAEAGQHWLEAIKAKGRERSTTDAYEQHLRLHINPRIGHLKLTELTLPLVADFEDRLRRDLSSSMVGRLMGSLRRMLANAQARGLVARNVARDMPRDRASGRDHIRALASGPPGVAAMAVDIDEASPGPSRRGRATTGRRARRAIRGGRQPPHAAGAGLHARGRHGALPGARSRGGAPGRDRGDRGHLCRLRGGHARAPESMSCVRKRVYLVGTSGSLISDMHAVIARLEAGALDTNISVTPSRHWKAWPTPWPPSRRAPRAADPSSTRRWPGRGHAAIAGAGRALSDGWRPALDRGVRTRAADEALLAGVGDAAEGQ